MPPCPNCKTKIEHPQKVFSVPSDLNRQQVFVEHKIALYECPRCQLKFPVGTGKTRLKIIDVSEWEALRKKAAEQEKLQAKVQELESQLQSLNEKLVLEELRSRQERLASEVAFLREIKSGLSDEIRAARRIFAE